MKVVKKLSYSEFKSIYTKVPRLTVELLVKSSQGILLVKRAIPPSVGSWYLPGGTVLFDETVEQAVERVAKEELGVEVATLKFLEVKDWYKTKNALGHPVSLIYQVKLKNSQIKLDRQSSDYGFFMKPPRKIMKEYKILFKSIG